MVYTIWISQQWRRFKSDSGYRLNQPHTDSIHKQFDEWLELRKHIEKNLADHNKEKFEEDIKELE